MPAALIDYDRLMQANLTQVFGEHDTGRRVKHGQVLPPQATNV